MKTDDFEILITVRGDAELDEEAVATASRYLVSRAAKTPPDKRIDWSTAQISASRLPKGA